MHRAVNRLQENIKYIQLAVCLTNTLDAVIADNGRKFVLVHNTILNELSFLASTTKKFFSICNRIYLTEAAAIKCGELGVVSLLLQQIRSECMGTSYKLNAIVTLGHCVEICGKNLAFCRSFCVSLIKVLNIKQLF